MQIQEKLSWQGDGGNDPQRREETPSALTTFLGQDKSSRPPFVFSCLFLLLPLDPSLFTSIIVFLIRGITFGVS